MLPSLGAKNEGEVLVLVRDAVTLDARKARIVESDRDFADAHRAVGSYDAIDVAGCIAAQVVASIPEADLMHVAELLRLSSLDHLNLTVKWISNGRDRLLPGEKRAAHVFLLVPSAV